MAEGPALLPDEAQTFGERQESPQPQARGAALELVRRPLVREWLAIGVVVWSLYLLACVCPVYVEVSYSDFPSSPQPVVGWQLLVWGWLWLFLFVPACLPWSANMLLLWGWIAFVQGRARRAAACSFLAVIAGLTTFAMPVERLLCGYYFWQTSLLIFAMAAGRLWRSRKTGLC